MTLTKDLALKLMNYYELESMEQLLKLISNDCPECYSTEINFYRNNKKEAIWRCFECKHLIPVPYDIDKTQFFIKN